MSRVYTAIAVLIFLVPWDSSYAQIESDCRDWSAVAELVQGRVEILRAGQVRWELIAEGARACYGDSVRTYPFARAKFAVPGESSFSLDENVTVTLQSPEDDTRFWLNLLRGTIHVISRRQGALKIITPYWNAGLRGTELLVTVDASAAMLSVYEGQAVVENANGRIEIPSSFRVVASANSNGELLVAGRNELIWALYYPRIIDGPLPDPDAGTLVDAASFAARAQSRMGVGRIPEAESDIASALRLDPGDASALALSSIISLIGGRSDAAALARAALAGDSQSIPALLAQSYVLQHTFELVAARGAAQAALQADGASALAAARLAELDFGVGAYNEARQHAERALDIDPEVALAHTVLGFIETAAGRLEAARERFDAAVRLDPSAPMPRLGLSELQLRLRNVDEGRAQAENAVALQPNDSVVRAYGARAYAEEGRQDLAGTQIEIAKALDAEDSTPFTFEAIAAYDENRPIRAVENLDQAMQRNANASPFRSRLTLDQDLGTRAAPYGGIYQSANYLRGALLTGAYSVTANPTDFSGHRLVADAYSQAPRQQTTRVNSSTQAKMRQPINLTPLAPELFEADISLMAMAGPAPLVHSEARSRYARKGLQAQVSAVMGNDDTTGEHVIGAFMQDRFSVSFGQFSFRTDGLRPNNGFEHDVFDISAQIRPTLSTSYQFDLRSVSSEYGDVDILFDISNYDESVRQVDEVDSLRFAARHRVSQNLEVLGFFSLESGDFQVSVPPFGRVDAKAETLFSEVQFVHQLPRWRLIHGLRVSEGDDEFLLRSLVPNSMPMFYAQVMTASDHGHALGYSYAHREIGEGLFLTIGVSVDRFDESLLDGPQFNPKLGLMWRFADNSYLRAAALRTTLGVSPSRHVIRPSLEPVQVAGFNQYFFGVEGERAEQYGIGIDHVFTANLRVGVELRERKLTYPGMLLSPLSRIDFLARETIDEAGVYWTPRSDLALSFAWQYEHFRNDGPADAMPEGFRFMRTKRLPISATLFAGNSVRLALSGTYVSQSGDFAFGSPGPGQTVRQANSEFAVYDVTLGYKLPNRQGTVELGLKNLTDEEFMYQDTDPYAPRLFYDRFFYSRFSLQF